MKAEELRISHRDWRRLPATAFGGFTGNHPLALPLLAVIRHNTTLYKLHKLTNAQANAVHRWIFVGLIGNVLKSWKWLQRNFQEKTFFCKTRKYRSSVASSPFLFRSCFASDYSVKKRQKWLFAVVVSSELEFCTSIRTIFRASSFTIHDWIESESRHFIRLQTQLIGWLAILNLPRGWFNFNQDLGFNFPLICRQETESGHF